MLRNAACALLLFTAGLGIGVVAAERPAATLTMAQLVDRALIEDMLHDYYANLGTGSHDFSQWFTEDGILDVNGQVGQGREGIEKIYKDTAARTGDRKGTFRMLLTNLRIDVKGDTATADMIWTGLLSETVTSPTKVVEQGREHDELVKRDGRWLFKHRMVTSDGGMPTELLNTYRNR